MNPIEEQRLIIDQLSQIVKGSCPKNSTSAFCRFEFHSFADGSSNVVQQFEYSEDGRVVSAALDRTLRAPVISLIKELHSIMLAHTGGNWQVFRLAINSDGSITAKFYYCDAPA